MIRIDLNSNVPLGEQIQSEIRRALAEQKIEPGDSLPPVRQLAFDLGVNLNTVSRAYQALEAQGLIKTRRGRGTIVCASEELNKGTHKEERQNMKKQIEKVIGDALLKGLNFEDIQNEFESVLDHYSNRRT